MGRETAELAARGRDEMSLDLGPALFPPPSLLPFGGESGLEFCSTTSFVLSAAVDTVAAVRGQAAGGVR